jgi:hypothetical protein
MLTKCITENRRSAYTTTNQQPTDEEGYSTVEIPEIQPHTLQPREAIYDCFLSQVHTPQRAYNAYALPWFGIILDVAKIRWLQSASVSLSFHCCQQLSTSALVDIVVWDYGWKSGNGKTRCFYLSLLMETLGHGKQGGGHMFDLKFWKSLRCTTLVNIFDIHIAWTVTAQRC